ncbi:MAG TPA: metal-sensitive transcriptional regulator [Jiangellales bacterium]|nr:metal-sensitive transcriptional regulator [Jiangellales bacterium]
MQIDQESAAEVLVRLRRVRGQVDGVMTMIEQGRECADIVTQMAAVSRALDRAGFKLVASGMEQCMLAESRGEEPGMSRERLEKLFLALA